MCLTLRQRICFTELCREWGDEMYIYIVRFANGERRKGTARSIGDFSDNLWRIERDAREMGTTIESFDARRHEGESILQQR